MSKIHESGWAIHQRTAITPSLGGIVFSRSATGPEGVTGNAHVTVLPGIRQHEGATYDRFQVAINIVDATVAPPLIGGVVLSYDRAERTGITDPIDYLPAVDNALLAGQLALTAAYDGPYVQFETPRPSSRPE